MQIAFLAAFFCFALPVITSAAEPPINRHVAHASAITASNQPIRLTHNRARIISPEAPVALSRNGDFLVTADNDSVKLWRHSYTTVETEILLPGVCGIVLGHHGRLVAFRLLTGSIVVWDLKVGRKKAEVGVFPESSFESPLAFSADDSLLAYLDDDRCNIWDLRSNNTVSYSLTGKDVDALSFYKDSYVLHAATADGDILSMHYPHYELKSLIAAAPDDATITNQGLHSFSTEGQFIGRCILDNRGDVRLQVINLAQPSSVFERDIERCHSSITIVRLRGTLFVAVDDSTVTKMPYLLNDIPTEQGCRIRLIAIDGHLPDTFLPATSTPTKRLLCSPDGQYAIAVSRYGSLSVFDLTNTQYIDQLEPEDTTSELQFSPDGKLLCASGPGGVRLWELENNTLAWSAHGRRALQFRRQQGSQATNTCLLVSGIAEVESRHSANGELLSCRTAIHNANVPFTVENEELAPCITLLELSADGKRAAYVMPLLEQMSIELLDDMSVDADSVSLPFTPNSLRFDNGSQELSMLSNGRAAVYSLADKKFSHDVAFSHVFGSCWYGTDSEELLFTRVDPGTSRITGLIGTVALSDVSLFSVLNSKEVVLIPNAGHLDLIPQTVSAASAPDKSVIVTGDAYGQIRLWDSQSGHLIGLYTNHYGGITALAISDDSRRMASASSSGEVFLWRISK